MKELLLRAARHNAWANERIIGVLETLPDEEWERELPSSFPSLRATVLHVWGAEDVWMQRFEGVQPPVWRAGNFSGTAGELCDAWRRSSAGFVRYIEGLDEGALSRVVHSLSLKGEPIADVLAAGLQHVFNHGTYHRGQLVTMLRQAGVTAIPQLDLIVFARLSN